MAIAIDESKITYSGDGEANLQNFDVYTKTEINSAVQGTSSLYDETAIYTLGSYCIYNNTLYRSTTAITTPEPFTSSHWESVSLSGLKEDFDSTMRGRNLLDNPFFTINQRGASSYTSSGYTVDRWRIDGNAKVTVNSDCSLTITAYGGTTSTFTQYGENASYLLGKTVMVSIIVDGTLYKGSYTFPTSLESGFVPVFSVGQGWTVYMGISSTTDNIWGFQLFHRDIDDHSITIKCAKVEVGTRCTLLNDTPPNYTTELLKCQRYLVRYNHRLNFGIGYLDSLTNARFIIQFPVAMRKSNPTLTYNIAAGSDICSVVAINDFNDIRIGEGNSSAHNVVLLVTYTAETGNTKGDGAYLRLAVGSYLQFSAEL